MPAMRSARTIRSLTLFNTALMLSAFTVPAFAIETVVVTAEKRVQNLQTVPVAVTAFTAEARDKIGISSIQDMANFTPGMTYSTSTDRVTIRGISRQTNVLSADSGVANYTDGIFQSFAVEAGRSTLDLDRVEILRGPQGTLYGRNSIGGAINQITPRPSDTFKAEIRADYGSYDHSLIEGMMTGPLSDDWQWRVYADWEKQGVGYTKNLIGPEEGQVINKWYAEGQLQGRMGNIDIWDRFYTTAWNNGAGDAGSAAGGWVPADYPTYEVGQGRLTMNPGYGCTLAPVQPLAPSFNPTYPNVAAAGGTTTAVGFTSPLANPCQNPSVTSPWHDAKLNPITTTVPGAYFNTIQATVHEDGFDIKLINGAEWYRYVLQGQVLPVDSNFQAPVTSVTIGASANPAFSLGFNGCDNPLGLNPFTPKGGTALTACPNLTEHPQTRGEYQQQEFFVQNEVNFVSTGNGPFQWQGGLYWFQQHSSQPNNFANPGDNQLGNPFVAAPGGAGTPPNGTSLFDSETVPAPAGYTLPEGPFTLPHDTAGNRWFDDRVSFNDTSLAAYGQADYKITDQVTLTGGLRFSYDKKYGQEESRLVLFGIPNAIFYKQFIPAAPPNLNCPPNNTGFIICVPFFAGPETLGSFTPAFDITPVGAAFPGGIDPGTCPPVSPTFIDYCTAPDKGVTAGATYDAASGFAQRTYSHSSSAVTGTAKITWQPDDQTTAYAYYSRGYKGGGYNTGIFSFINPKPWVDPEHVNAYEIGLKKTFDEFLVLDSAVYYYDYSKMQVPVSVAASPGGTNSPEFINIPHAASVGFETEAFITPIEHMLAVVSYSFDDAHITSSKVAQFNPLTGVTTFNGVADPTDPNAVVPGAKPLYTLAQCAATQAKPGTPGILCTPDIYTLDLVTANPQGSTGACVFNDSPNQGCGYGWVIPQSLKGNRLPNVPKNKIAVNVQYDWNIPDFGIVTPSVTWRWVGKQYGSIFTRFYNAAPSWDQWDARIGFASPDSNWNFYIYGRNLANKIGYAQGALGFRYAGTVATGGATAPTSGAGGSGAVSGYPGPFLGSVNLGSYCDGTPGNGGIFNCNFVQGQTMGVATATPTGFGRVRGESPYGTVSDFSVNPPTTYGIQLQYRF